MSDETYKLFREYIYQLTGIYFQDNKKYLLEGRLVKRVQALNLTTFENYFQFIKFSPRRQEEMNSLFEAITINETFFFRNEPQFEAFETVLVPELFNKKQVGGRCKLRVWSAASSSGEEAHTLAMIYLEKLKPKYPGLELEVVGTDISPAVLDIAKKGIYRDYSVRSMPKYYFDRYFDVTEPGRYKVVDDARRLIRFEHLNLFDHVRLKMMINFDIIFCCNVLIYFDAKSKIQVVSSLYNALNHNGFLFIGYSETLHGISSAFKLVNFPKTVVYKKE